MKTEITHTPGPWQMLDDQITNEDGSAIGEVYGAESFTSLGGDEMTDEGLICEANARLICAAPDMLEALEAIKALAHPMSTHIHKVCDDAIANATSGANHRPA